MLTQAMDVLALYTATRRELGVAEVAKMLGRSKSTVSGWMSAMLEVGLLDRDEGGGPYRLGIRLAALGELAKRSTSAQRVATPLLEQLTRRTRETASLNMLIGSEVVNSVVVESPLPIHSAGGLGIPMPLHATAAGKVLLAWKTPEHIRHLLPLRLEQFTPDTISDIEILMDELRAIRQRGYSIANGELAPDLFAVSAPVRDSAGVVVCAISLTAPVSRISAQQIPLLAQDLMAAAEAVSLALGFQKDVSEVAAD
jgi:DNA-binding IclR family transcriptional regulator